jgi:hypothetical protein
MEQRRFLEATLGVYVATLLVPAAALAGWESGAVDLSVGVFVAAGAAIAAIVGLAVRAVDEIVDRLCSLPVVVVTVGLPFLYPLPYLISVVDPDSGLGVVAIVGLGAVLPGVLALVGGSLIRNSRLREQSTEIVSVTVGETDDEKWQQLRIAAVAVVGIALIGAGVATFVTGDDSFSTLIAPLGGLSAMLAVFGDNGRELVVTDAGLVVDHWFVRWEAFDGYRLSDETVELVRPAWYHQTRTFDREEMDDEDALINGVAEFLPRVDEQGRVERTARN